MLCPASLAELGPMLRRAIYEIKGPVAVRYPRGGEDFYIGDHSVEPACVLREGSDLTLLTFGSLTGNVLQAAERLEQDGISAQVVKLNQLAPLPAEPVLRALEKTERLLIAQECTEPGSPGEGILAAAAAAGLTLKGAAVCSCGKDFVTHGTIPQLRRLCGLDVDSLYQKAREVAAYGSEKTVGRPAH